MVFVTPIFRCVYGEENKQRNSESELQWKFYLFSVGVFVERREHREELDISDIGRWRWWTDWNIGVSDEHSQCLLQNIEEDIQLEEVVHFGSQERKTTSNDQWKYEQSK